MQYSILDPSWALTKRKDCISIPIRLFCKKPEGSIIIKERFLSSLDDSCSPIIQRDVNVARTSLRLLKTPIEEMVLDVLRMEELDTMKYDERAMEGESKVPEIEKIANRNCRNYL